MFHKVDVMACAWRLRFQTSEYIVVSVFVQRRWLVPAEETQCSLVSLQFGPVGQRDTQKQEVGWTIKGYECDQSPGWDVWCERVFDGDTHTVFFLPGNRGISTTEKKLFSTLKNRLNIGSRYC